VGAVVGAFVGSDVGALVGDTVGPGEGAVVGAFVGSDVGALVGDTVGPGVGAVVGAFVGSDVGAFVGDTVGPGEGTVVGDALGIALVVSEGLELGFVLILLGAFVGLLVASTTAKACEHGILDVCKIWHVLTNSTFWPAFSLKEILKAARSIPVIDDNQIKLNRMTKKIDCDPLLPSSL